MGCDFFYPKWQPALTMGNVSDGIEQLRCVSSLTTHMTTWPPVSHLQQCIMGNIQYFLCKFVWTWYLWAFLTHNILHFPQLIHVWVTLVTSMVIAPRQYLDMCVNVLLVLMAKTVTLVTNILSCLFLIFNNNSMLIL